MVQRFDANVNCHRLDALILSFYVIISIDNSRFKAIGGSEFDDGKSANLP